MSKCFQYPGCCEGREQRHLVLVSEKSNGQPWILGWLYNSDGISWVFSKTVIQRRVIGCHWERQK